MIDESSIIPFAASGIGFFCLIGACLGCRRMIIKKQVEREKQELQAQQAAAVIHVPIEGGYVGGFTVSGYAQPVQNVVYPNYPAYGVYGSSDVYGTGYGNRIPAPSAPPGPPGNYLGTSVVV